MSSGNATVDLTTAGEHTLDAWMREDGLRVDRVLLVTDTNYIPSGLGPAESPFQTITETIPGGLGTTSISYGYDALYRLTGATYSGAITATFAYDYDPVGNMTAFTETVDAQTTSVSRTFDNANRLEYAVDASGTTTYTYNANGNLIELLPPGATGATPVGGVRYDYDQRNLMTSQETNPDGTAWVLQAEYVYDGADDRLQQIDYTGATPITTTYTNDIFGLTQVLVADDGTTQVYNLLGLDLISQDSGAEVRTLIADGLGSVRQEMVGAVVETVTTYSPYGKVLEQSGISGTVYGFTGEQEDSATGLLYLRARYYSPALKVFQSRDPWQGTGWRPATLNYYAYVNGNPVNWVDLTGNDIEVPHNVELDPSHPWTLPAPASVQELAATFNIPPELLGAILQIVQEVDYSTTGILSNDWLEDCIFGALAFAAHPAYFHPPLNLQANILLKESLILAGLVDKHPSPGLTQIQLRRAEQMEQWLFQTQAGRPEYDPMRQALGRSEGTTDLLTRLYTPETAIIYAAAHIRWLVEEEYGEEMVAQELSMDQMSIIAVQYNVGPRSEVAVEDYSGYVFYEVARAYIRVWQLRLSTISH